MDRVCMLLVIVLIDIALWAWWQSTGSIFSQPISSISLGDMFYGLLSRVVVVSGAIGSLSLATLIYKLD